MSFAISAKGLLGIGFDCLPHAQASDTAVFSFMKDSNSREQSSYADDWG